MNKLTRYHRRVRRESWFVNEPWLQLECPIPWRTHKSVFSNFVGTIEFKIRIRKYRFQVKVEFMVFLFGIQAVHHVDVVRICQVVVREGHENGQVELAGGDVGDARRIANASGTEAPVLRVMGMSRAVRKDPFGGGKTIRQHSGVDHVFFVVERHASTYIRRKHCQGRAVASRREALAVRSVDHPAKRLVKPWHTNAISPLRFLKTKVLREINKVLYFGWIFAEFQRSKSPRRSMRSVPVKTLKRPS